MAKAMAAKAAAGAIAAAKIAAKSKAAALAVKAAKAAGKQAIKQGIRAQAKARKGVQAAKKAGQAARRKADELAKQSGKNPEEMEPSGKYADSGDPDDNFLEATAKSFIDPRNTVAYEQARGQQEFVQKGEFTTASGDKRSITNPFKSKDEFDTSDKNFITTNSGEKMSFDEYSGQQYQPYRVSAKQAKEYYTYSKQQKRRDKSKDQHLVESIAMPV